MAAKIAYSTYCIFDWERQKFPVSWQIVGIYDDSMKIKKGNSHENTQIEKIMLRKSKTTKFAAAALRNLETIPWWNWKEKKKIKLIFFISNLCDLTSGEWNESAEIMWGNHRKQLLSGRSGRWN